MKAIIPVRTWFLQQSFNALRNLCFWGDYPPTIKRGTGKSPIYFDSFPINTSIWWDFPVMFDYPKQLVNPSIWRFPSFHGIPKLSSRHECMRLVLKPILTLLLSPINSIHFQAFTTWVTAGQGVHPSSDTHLAKGLAELRVWIDAWKRWRPSGHPWEHLPSGYLTL